MQYAQCAGRARLRTPCPLVQKKLVNKRRQEGGPKPKPAPAKPSSKVSPSRHINGLKRVSTPSEVELDQLHEAEAKAAEADGSRAKNIADIELVRVETSTKRLSDERSAAIRDQRVFDLTNSHSVPVDVLATPEFPPSTVQAAYFELVDQMRALSMLCASLSHEMDGDTARHALHEILGLLRRVAPLGSGHVPPAMVDSDVLERMQHHQSDEVYKLAYGILIEFFECDEV